MGSNIVQAQAAGTGRIHLPSDGPGGFISVCMLTLYSRISKCNVVDRGVCCAERGERFGDSLRLIIRQFPQSFCKHRTHAVWF